MSHVLTGVFSRENESEKNVKFRIFSIEIFDQQIEPIPKKWTCYFKTLSNKYPQNGDP